MKKGDIIKFGNYPQDSNGSISPIEWLVLDVKENESLLISRYGLDCQMYHHECTDITWEDCNLRKWLNSYLIKSAFSKKERKTIKVSELKNDDNQRHDYNRNKKKQLNLLLINGINGGKITAQSNLKKTFQPSLPYLLH